MGNCESYTDGIEELPGAREKSYSSSGTAVLFDRIDALKKRNALLEQDTTEAKSKQNELQAQLADLQKENNQFQREHDEVESVVMGFEKAMDKVVAEKDAIVAELRAELSKTSTAKSRAMSETEDLNEKMISQSREVSRLRSRQSQTQAERDQLEADANQRIEDLQKELASAYANIAQAQSELLCTKASLSVATDKHAQLKLRSAALEDQLDELTDRYNRRESLTRAQAQKQLDQAKELMVQGRKTAQTEIDVARKESADLRLKVSQLAVALERANAEKLLIQSKATASQSTINQSNLIREALEKEVIEKEDKLKKVNLELYELERKYQTTYFNLEEEKKKSVELQALAEEAISQAESTTTADSPLAKKLAMRRASMAALTSK